MGPFCGGRNEKMLIQRIKTQKLQKIRHSIVLMENPKD